MFIITSIIRVQQGPAAAQDAILQDAVQTEQRAHVLGTQQRQQLDTGREQNASRQWNYTGQHLSGQSYY